MSQYKETKKLYHGKYQYKIVLICPGVSAFRGNNLDQTFVKLSNLSIHPNTDTLYSHRLYSSIVRQQSEIVYLFDLYDCFTKMIDYTVRVESPWLSVYSNNEDDIESLKSINENRVKVIYRPLISLNKGEIVSSLPYDYKVTIKSQRENQDSFVDWAKQFDTIRLTYTCADILTNGRVWPIESYFYVRGEKTLTMAKLHLGGLIQRIEKIVSHDVNV